MSSAEGLIRDYELLDGLYVGLMADNCETDQLGEDHRAYARWAYMEIGDKLLDEIARWRAEPFTEPRSTIELVDEFRAEMSDFLSKTTSKSVILAFSIALDEANWILDTLTDIYEMKEQGCLQFSA